jgi:hypothetical protein
MVITEFWKAGMRPLHLLFLPADGREPLRQMPLLLPIGAAIPASLSLILEEVSSNRRRAGPSRGARGRVPRRC